MAVYAFGYAEGRETSGDQPVRLSEVTFVASPEVLRRIAQHLNDAADALEHHPNPVFGHVHLRDKWDKWSEDDVDVIVAR